MSKDYLNLTIEETRQLENCLEINKQIISNIFESNKTNKMNISLHLYKNIDNYKNKDGTINIKLFNIEELDALCSSIFNSISFCENVKNYKEITRVELNIKICNKIMFDKISKYSKYLIKKNI